MKALLKKWLLLNSLIIFFFTISARAQSFQNIVLNGGFETYTQCPNSDGQIYFSTPWKGPQINSSDYFNSCSTLLNVPQYGGTGTSYPYYLNAKDGQAYAGIHVYSSGNYREYLQVEFKDTMKLGKCYYLEFYATNGQYVPFAVNNIAANLSTTGSPTTLTPANSLLNVPSHITNYGNPVLKDTVNWIKISGIYESQGNEMFLTIGNFNTDNNTDTFRIYPLGTGPVLSANHAYIFVDAVSMYSLNPTGTLPWSYRDTIIDEGDSVFIGNQMGGINFQPKWYKEDGTYIKTNAGITVTPNITSKYVIEFDLCGVTRRDTIKVTVIPKLDVGINKLNKLSRALKIYPQPVSDLINFENEMIAEGEVVSVSIETSFGQTLKKEELIFRSKKAKLKTDDLPDGVYFVTFRNQNNESITKKMVVAK